MNGGTVLLCSRVRVDASAQLDASGIVVEDLCERPAAAAAALREAEATRVVLGLCERRPSAELVAALRRAGAAPFGIEAVMLAGRRPDEAARLVAGARARLDALAPGERGRSTVNGGAISRRSLFSLGGALAQARIAVLDQTACVGSSRCGLCVGRCPTDAITATAPLPTIDPAACTACGLCVAGCPHEALRLTGAATAQFEAQLEQLAPGVSGIVFACEGADADAPPGWALVELPTLALLTPGWLFQLRARDVEVRLVPCGNACCAGAHAVEAFVAGVLRDRESSRDTRPERVLLTEPLATVEALRHLVRPGSTAVIEAGESPLGLVALDAERCTLCGVCAAVCPTEALRLDETAGETVLRLRADACIGCARCVTACPERALGVRPGIDLARLGPGAVDLAGARHETCVACGADLPPRPMRRRLRELLPELSGAPLELCARCATRAPRRQAVAPAAEAG